LRELELGLPYSFAIEGNHKSHGKGLEGASIAGNLFCHLRRVITPPSLLLYRFSLDLGDRFSPLLELETEASCSMGCEILFRRS
jgi:hypothetical protein